MKNIIKILFLLIFTVLFGSYSLGQEFSQDEVITLYSGDTKVIAVNNPTRVIINNPSIADVTSVSKSEMIIAAKSVGTTNLVWWDGLGQHSALLQVFLEDMEIIKQRADAILKELEMPGVFTRKADSEGKVLLLGAVKSAQDRERVNFALATLKQKIVDLIVVREEETVVEIGVQVLELNKDATKTLGFTMPGSITVAEPSTRFGKTIRGSMNALFHVFDWPRSDFSATLDLLVQEGKARVLSHPRLACQSGKEAELLVGGEKPIFTTSVVSGGGTGTEVEYKEYGIKLKIKPTVTEKEQIKLALNVEVSDVGAAETIGTTSTGETTAKAYPLTKRSASTELFLNNGQTMAIGGLVKQKTEEDIRKTAFLGDIPIIGLFFRKKTTREGGGQGERGDSELFITLTPTIISKKEEVQITPPKKATQVKERASRVKEEAATILNPDQKYEQIIARYTQLVAKQIQDNLVYPGTAYNGQLEGSLKLILHLASTGQLMDVKIMKSSGIGMLDENALQTVKDISPFLPFPPEIKEDSLSIEVPVVYALK